MFCIDLQFLIKVGKPFAMFWPPYLMWRSNHTSFSICFVCPLSFCFSACLYIPKFPKIWSTGETFFKLWKIINFRTLLKTKEELKKIKVMFISESAGKNCAGEEGRGWRIFVRKTSTVPSELVYSWKFGRAL